MLFFALGSESLSLGDLRVKVFLSALAKVFGSWVGGAGGEKRKGGEREEEEGRRGAGGRAKRVGRRAGMGEVRRGRRKEGKGCFGYQNLYFSPARQRRAENFGPPVPPLRGVCPP